MNIISWFSCGNNSAVATKLTLEKYPNADIIIARCIIDNEHEDNERFHEECERWFNHPITKIKSEDYKDCWEVWEKRRYISGIKGAPCTIEMKKVPRWNLEKIINPTHQVTPLIDEHLTKQECAQVISAVGIKQPIMYDLGFKNNNCIACAKATSIIYWARTRHHFPDQFNRMAELSRRLNVRMTKYKGQRIFLDEIPQSIDYTKPIRQQTECSLLCAGS